MPSFGKTQFNDRPVSIRLAQGSSLKTNSLLRARKAPRLWAEQEHGGSGGGGSTQSHH